ncbi:olfactory receptor 6C74-like [Heteronotia binoei]|uniref:olfactory receptor 6C74-like n=1 Tax=Heteronotia binoei TaxID=13085 RepID=UPI00292EA626|nr:olfactory receptor 6C74-like [Heteronotia binoei]
MANGTRVKEFILLGLTDDYKLKILIFLLLFSTYMLTIMGNLLIIAITLVDHRLYTPMYFFLRHVAFVEIGYTTTIIPKALANMAMGQKTISVAACFTQTYLYFSLGTTEFFLLAVMSVDRYVAVCNPLRYSTIMNDRICSLLVLCCWIVGFLLIFGPAVALFQMSFCGSNTINHFFCDNGPLLKLVCADTDLVELMSFLSAILTLIGSLTVNLVSYGHIIFSVLCIPSTAGRQKAFSTCSSHIIVVSITYGSCIFLYVKPKGTSRLDFSKSVAVLNTIISPLLIPFIYCLRNKQVKDALIGTFRKGLVLWKNARR